MRRERGGMSVRRTRARATGREFGCVAWSSLFVPFAGFLQERQDALPLGPIAGAVLNDFLQLDLGVRYVGDETEVLPHVVAFLDPIEGLVGLHEGVGFLVLRKRAHHLELLEREGLQRLLPAIDLLLD